VVEQMPRHGVADLVFFIKNNHTLYKKEDEF